MININVEVKDETHRAAKAAAAAEGMPFYRFVERSLRRAAGLQDSPVHEISLEDKLSASVKRVNKK